MIKLSGLLVSLLMLSGCSVFPYQSEFSCSGVEDFGKCVPVEKAYNEAVTGTPAGEPMTRAGKENTASKSDSKTPADRSAERKSAVRESYSSYRAAMYKKLGDMLNQPITPMVNNPTPKRALILPYTTRGDGKPLYLPRYVMFFTDEPAWLLGQHLNSSDAIGPTIGTLGNSSIFGNEASKP